MARLAWVADGRAALYGRVVLGAAAVAAGVVSIVWHDSQVWRLVAPLAMPAAQLIAWCVAIAQVVAGITMMFAQTARVASIVLGIVYGFFSAACIPGMAKAPADPGQYVVFFERLSIVCGALAVYALQHPRAVREGAMGRAARVGLGICTLSFAWAQIVYFQYTASLVPTWIPPSQNFWTVLTTVAFALAGFAILIRRQARLAIQLMTLMMALFGLLVWLPRIIVHPADLSAWTEISANYVMAGAVWMVGLLPALASRGRYVQSLSSGTAAER